MQPQWPGELPDMPSNCLTRAQTHLNMARLGLSDMSVLEQDRAVLGFCGVAVFGRSVTLALQHLRKWDRQAFDEWYGPWRDQMTADPLSRFFYDVRTEVLHGGVPNISYTLFAAGLDVPEPGTIRVSGRPLPTEHRGVPIEDNSTLNLCRLYVAYLEEMIDSVATVVWQIQDRWLAEQQSASNGGGADGEPSSV